MKNLELVKFKSGTYGVRQKRGFWIFTYYRYFCSPDYWVISNSSISKYAHMNDLYARKYYNELKSCTFEVETVIEPNDFNAGLK